jgi:hypothetical protein
MCYLTDETQRGERRGKADRADVWQQRQDKAAQKEEVDNE